jgi:glycogen phosphorylase
MHAPRSDATSVLRRFLLDQAGFPWEEDSARRAILNVGHSGRFSSDRTIAEYAAESWRVEPYPVP